MGSSEKQRSASLERSRILCCETGNREEGILRIILLKFYLSFLTRKYNKRLVLSLSTPIPARYFQTACQCQILIECLETITV